MSSAARFIPAGAGNTRNHPQAEAILPVYPRWRGEHDLTVIATRYAGGLSPLARGTRFYGRPGGKNRRFIPAGAGNTVISTRRPVNPAVYPRWRGEHILKKIGQEDADGLSPLARGTRQCSGRC